MDDANLLHPDYDFAPRALLLAVDIVCLKIADAISTGFSLTLSFARKVKLKHPVIYTPNGIHMPDGSSSKNKSFEGTKNVLFVGSLSFHQNVVAVTHMLGFAKKLDSMGVDFRIQIVGGPVKHISEHLDSEIVRKGKVKLWGIVSEKTLDRIQKGVDIGVLPFFSDTPLVGGQRTKALQYMVYGLAVISGPEGIGYVPGIEPNTQYVHVADESSFEEHLRRMILNLDEYIEVAKNGRNAVVRRFSWRRTTEELFAYIYESE